MFTFTDANGREVTIVRLCNETTASGHDYIASPEMAELVAAMTEEELSKLMPEQTSASADDPADYAAALIAHAQLGGMPDDDIILESLEIPDYWFTSGWLGQDASAGETTVNEPSHPFWQDPPAEFYVPELLGADISLESDIVDIVDKTAPDGWESWGFALDRKDGVRRLVCALVNKGADRMRDADVENDEFASYCHVGGGKMVMEVVNRGEREVLEHQPVDGYVREWNPDIPELVSFVRADC